MKLIQLFLQRVYLKLPVILFDILMIPVAWFMAFGLRLGIHPMFSDIPPLFMVIGIQVASYYIFRVYRGLWRYASLNDVTRIIKAVFSAAIINGIAFYTTGWYQMADMPQVALHALILVSMLCGARLLLRSFWDKRTQKLDDADAISRVLVVGAGAAGEAFVREIKRTKAYLPVGIVDDERKKRGLELHGIRVLGTIPQLPELAAQTNADLIVIAIPSASSADMRRIVSYCESCHVPFRTVPSLSAITSGQVEVSTLRPVNIEDLLGRDQVELTWGKIEATIHHRPIAITGAGGSIGSELCRQIARLKPSKLLLIDNSEPNLFHIERELSLQFPGLMIESALISVVDRVAVKTAFLKFKPAVVLHAAAYKHVPLLEHQIRVAVKNNVIGTQVVAEVSVECSVQKFILISTDKAVNPTNVMGTTKRVAEIYCQNLNERVDTQFITVRFGNVLGSVGSVVPLFQKQLNAGGPLTVTHPDIQRYFMTIPEASQLILQAMANGTGGEIFVLDMGEPIKISYLAEQMIRLAGLVPGEDIQIEYIGLRPGEKLFEELFHPSEALTQTEHEKLFKARVRYMPWDELKETLRLIKAACNSYENEELLVLLKSLVPEFKAVPKKLVNT